VIWIRLKSVSEVGDYYLKVGFSRKQPGIEKISD
jgi:hypothetical protein